MLWKFPGLSSCPVLEFGGKLKLVGTNEYILTNRILSAQALHGLPLSQTKLLPVSLNDLQSNDIILLSRKSKPHRSEVHCSLLSVLTVWDVLYRLCLMCLP